MKPPSGTLPRVGTLAPRLTCPECQNARVPTGPAGARAPRAGRPLEVAFWHSAQVEALLILALCPPLALCPGQRGFAISLVNNSGRRRP
jgi:hypothetical protein